MSRLLPPRFLLPSRRFFSQTTCRTAFATSPSPPRLPPKEQEEFERLQRSSTSAFSTPKTDVITNSLKSTSRAKPQINQSPATTLAEKEDIELAAVNARVSATGKGEELHPDIRRGAKPEFEGEINPKTGEVGGPKNEPLRWGSSGERGIGVIMGGLRTFELASEMLRVANFRHAMHSEDSRWNVQPV